MKKIALILFVLTFSVYPFQQFVNYAPTVAVNGFAKTGDTLWVASGGGLFVYNTVTGHGELLNDHRRFPDPHLTSVVEARNGDLWIGSRNGYLYRRTKNGVFSVFSSYFRAGWGIVDLYEYQSYIIVGSQRGVSVFDPQKEAALKNAANIGNFSNSRVNTITSFNDSLILGCEEGVAVLTADIERANFYDRTVWRTDFSSDSSAVVDFFVENGELIPSSGLTFSFRGSKYIVEKDGIAYSNDTPILNFGLHEKIIAWYVDSNDNLWIGTDNRYFFRWDGITDVQQVIIEGIPLKNISEMLLTSNGDLWFLPSLVYLDGYQPWNNGVVRFDGSNWTIYNAHTHGAAFGYIGDLSMQGLMEDQTGDIWTGSWGGNIKHISLSQNRLGQLVVGTADNQTFEYVKDAGPPVWGKVDALTFDNNGYMWFSPYDHELGAVICYDPRRSPDSNADTPTEAGFRRFFPNGHSDWTLSITKMATDNSNRIFTVDHNNHLKIMEYNGTNPLQAQLSITRPSANLGVIADLEAATSGIMWIAGSNGLYAFIPSVNTPFLIDNDIGAPTSVAVQNDSTLWIATEGNGLLKYQFYHKDRIPVSQSIADMERFSYFFEVEKQYVTMDHGLLSDNITHVAVDNNKGLLWAVTDAGLTSYYIGSEEKVPSGSNVIISPNPYSISNRDQASNRIVFSKLEPRTEISVYTVNGQLVQQLRSQRVSDHEWQSEWKPQSSIVPGIYMVIARPSGDRGKLILVP